jgi:hypothetical protein
MEDIKISQFKQELIYVLSIWQAAKLKEDPAMSLGVETGPLAKIKIIYLL